MRFACMAARGRPCRRGLLDRAVVPGRSGYLARLGLTDCDAHGQCAVQRQQAEVSGYGDGLYSRSSGRPRHTLHRADEGGAAAVLHLWGDRVQHLWLSVQGRLWIDPPACSCACVAASRFYCVPSAITASCIAARRARPLGVTNIVAAARSATKTAAAADSSTRRARLAGVGAGAACAWPAKASMPIK